MTRNEDNSSTKVTAQVLSLLDINLTIKYLFIVWSKFCSYYLRVVAACLPPSTPQHRTMAWHKGSWWPLFVKEWYGPRCSQHMLDPYSFVILVLGLVLHLLWGTDNIGNWVFGFLGAILVELVWEIIGNSSYVLKRIKANSGTSGEYNGNVE